MQRAFVTGGSGFVGGHLVADLRARGVAVRALARSDRAARRVADAGAEVVRGDLLDERALTGGMTGADVVFHAAALTRHFGGRAEAERVNVAGTAAVAGAARAADVGRLVHVSSEVVLAGAGVPVVGAREDLPRAARPIGPYAATKARAEEVVLAGRGPRLAVVIVRPRLVWGPGDTKLRGHLIEAARARRFTWIDGGRYPTSTCHVRNLCAALWLAAERGRDGRVYHVTDGEPVELRWFLSELIAGGGVDPGRRSLPRWLMQAVAWSGEALWTALPLPGRPPISRSALRMMGEEVTLDDRLARDELGYRPVVTVADGLAELAQVKSRRARVSAANVTKPADSTSPNAVASSTGPSPTE